MGNNYKHDYLACVLPLDLVYKEGRRMLASMNIGSKALEAMDEGRKYYDLWKFKKAEKCLKEAAKYKRQLRMAVLVLDQIPVLISQTEQCAHLQSLVERVYDAIDADKRNHALDLITDFHKKLQKYLTWKKFAMDNDHAQKFKIKIHNARQYLSDISYDVFAREHLGNAKNLAKRNKHKQALLELDKAEKCALCKKTMNLISTERLNIQQERDRKDEESENYRLNISAFTILSTIKNDIANNASSQLTIRKYEKAASLATDKNLKKKIKHSKTRFLDNAVPYCINEAKELVKENKFEAANSKLDEALCMAKDVLCPKNHLSNVQKEIRSAYNARAKYLHKIANDFVKENKVNEAEEKFQEALCFAKDESIINLIKADKAKTDKDMKAIQIDNKRAMVLLELGQVHAMKNEFQLAEEKLQVALQSTNDEALKEKIKTEAASTNAKHVKYLQKEANDLLSQNKFKESIDIFKEAVSIVVDISLRKSVKAEKSKAVNQYTKLLLKQANGLADQNKFKEAYDNIDEALNLNEEDPSTALDCKAMTKNKEGMFCLKESFKLETSQPFTEIKYKEAKEKLNRAHDLFKEAEERTKTKQEKNIKIVESKINGNKCFNDALLLEGKAFDIYEDAKKDKNLAQYTSVQEKYHKAKELYEKAKEHFTIGFKLGCEEFQTSINLAADQVSNISKVIESIDVLKLKCQFDKELEMEPAIN